METRLQICNHCSKEYAEPNYLAGHNEKRGRKRNFCNNKCRLDFFNTSFLTNCKTCGKQLQKSQKHLNKSKTGFFFCTRTCAANFNNQIRQKKRRSKIEQALFQMIKNAFPDLEIISNDRKALDGLEIDIYIPKIKLAIEWNGIVHFKPIYGLEKLLAVQEKDRQKMQLANTKEINLIVIPDHQSKYSLVKDSFSKIKEIIEKLLSK